MDFNFHQLKRKTVKRKKESEGEERRKEGGKKGEGGKEGDRRRQIRAYLHKPSKTSLLLS